MNFEYQKNSDLSITIDDLVYGSITIPFPYSEMILTKEMLRLYEISQNGFAYLKNDSLKYNDRLRHSIGSFYIMNMIINKIEQLLKKYNLKIDSNLKEIALTSILLHDIGHGPFSHSFETVTKYSHENRCKDIILGDTEINNLLFEIFGEFKTKKIADLVSKTNDYNTDNNYNKIIKKLLSNNLDCDRLDYLIRDAYYAGKPQMFDLNKIIDSINLTLNDESEFELIFQNDALSNIENIIIQRYQMYRDIYFEKNSIIGDYLFNSIIKKYKYNKELQKNNLFDIFKYFINSKNINNFLNLREKDIIKGFKALENNKIDPVLSYLCKFNIDDFIILPSNIKIDTFKSNLKEIFKEYNLDNTLSILNIKRKNNLYDYKEGINILDDCQVKDLTECSNLIKSSSIFMVDNNYFNPELLRIELGISKENYQVYLNKINNLINNQYQESTLKYSVSDFNILTLLVLLKDNGYKILETKDVIYEDNYYDTNNLDLYKNKEIFRVRNKLNDLDYQKKISYKKFNNNFIIEDLFETDNFKQILLKYNLDNLSNDALIDIITNRRKITLEKDGVKVYMIFDCCCYNNKFLDNNSEYDNLIGVKILSNIQNKIILKEINTILKNNFNNVELINENKYERAINKTLLKYENNKKLIKN